MARLPPSRHPLHCGLRIPDLRARDDSPLNGSCHQGVPAICRTRRLPAQRIRRCGLNATFRTRLQQCDGDWSPLSPRCYRVAHAARLGTDTEICDTVRLEGIAAPRGGAARAFEQVAMRSTIRSVVECFTIDGGDTRKYGPSRASLVKRMSLNARRNSKSGRNRIYPTSAADDDRTRVNPSSDASGGERKRTECAAPQPPHALTAAPAGLHYRVFRGELRSRS